ncbi:XF1762 family protein [uncultured Brevundimonas sp.]|uniref:XF1762 family protein n=1 Tax=uncultured Brevundimonas sp. TaxID=213418 RepID=UPI0025FC7116|nr:XF1762 family protein [uncultured Brevundimonas sp.]
MTLRHQRIEFADAASFVAEHHRHHTPPVGHLFSIGAFVGDDLIGVAIVGRPVARHRDDGLTAEVTRLCVVDGARNVPSFLLGKCARAALALGFRRIGTYTLAREAGTSLRAAGWVVVAHVEGRSWNTPSRRRSDKHPTENKLLWEPANQNISQPKDAAA